MLNQFSRTQLLIGEEAIQKLAKSRVAVFGIGGVGGYVCEALVRSGVGAFDLVDDDKVCLTNLNRQIIATRKTVGKYKVEVMKERMLEINPDVDVRTYQCFFLPENAAESRRDQALSRIRHGPLYHDAHCHSLLQSKKISMPQIAWRLYYISASFTSILSLFPALIHHNRGNDNLIRRNVGLAFYNIFHLCPLCIRHLSHI